ncbi:526e2c84-53f9-4eb1-aeba-83057cdbfd79 [Thermothielavioides terrestris]|uniref:526e2c84-53f9-4eb1-aeba-83057cdbfd79 n=1 Tax=Thermothielavioides terrestris TaxID=2587410 RepID=A0A446BUI2_9PEZI|nr:526e2c84-53f9-4eb1-aeba-83057cdbfd79 [Thermothielavioides terrestris]
MRLHRLLLAGLAVSAPRLVNGDDGCTAEAGTYSNETMPAGTFQPYDQLNPVLGDDNLATSFYITVVNLTPHRFKLDGTHSYQMDTFDFGDVPQGRARQNAVKYQTALQMKDDAGEAYYVIDGTDQKFAVRVKSYAVTDAHPRRVTLDLSGMNLGQREYVWPGGQTSVSLVITGSQSAGFAASLTHGPGNWMRSIYDVIRDRPVRHLVMPGTHDAGMSEISNQIDSIGTEQNTQTQGINIYNQLRAGSRWFDLRIGSVHDVGNAAKNQGFWVMHLNDETADIAVGNTGESLDDVVKEINQFTTENPGEIIFLAIRYLVGRYEIPAGGPILWNASTVNDFFTKLRGISTLCPDLDTSTGFQNQKASYFMDRNGGKGCVIPLLNGQNLQDGVPHESTADGIYAMGRMDIQDHWSNMMQAADMAPDQVSNWRAATRGGAADYGSFMIAQWLVTPDAVASTAYSLQEFAIQPTNPSLYWAGVNGMDPQHWPNVLLIDYIGVQQTDLWDWDQLSAEMYTLALGLNTYLVSENCDVSQQRSPLRRRNRGLAAGGGGRRRRLPSWNGIIFANGTTLHRPPPTLHPGRAEILKQGTVLGNGTVLERSIPNPWW